MTGRDTSPAILRWSVALAAVGGAMGCTDPHTKTARDPAGFRAKPNLQANAPAPVEHETAIHLDLDPSLEPCSGSTYFFFDVADLKPQGQRRLEALVACLQGPTHARYGIELVGHADPEGPADYNVDLARRRAESVEEQLVAFGLSADRIAIRSEGESEAKSPTGPHQPGYDRRVDLRMIDFDRAPR